MTGLWFLPFVVAGLLGVILASGARAGARSPERELQGLVRADVVANLTASLRDEPRWVRATRRSSFRNRLVLDLGDTELQVCCYTMPRVPVQVLTAVYFQSSVGWVVETASGGQRTRHYGWLLDVRSHTG